MGDGSRTEETGRAGADNVIKFPRDWFGSVDDLVPFGPAADRLEAEAAARAVARATEGATAAVTADAHEGLASALNANDFWGGSSEALQQPVDVLPDEPLALALPARVVAPAVTPEDRQLLLVAADDVVVHSRTRLPVALRAAAGAVVALVAVVVAVLVVSQGAPDHRTGRENATLAAATQAPTGNATAAGVGISTSSDVALANRSRVQTTSRIARKPATKTRHRTRAKISKRRVAAKHRASADHSVSTVVADASTDDLSSSEPVSEDSSSSTSAGTTAPSSGGSASSGSTSDTAGPGGLGGAVGSGCNPTCSAQ